MLPNSTFLYCGTWIHVLCISLSDVILNSDYVDKNLIDMLILCKSL